MKPNNDTVRTILQSIESGFSDSNSIRNATGLDVADVLGHLELLEEEGYIEGLPHRSSMGGTGGGTDFWADLILTWNGHNLR